MVLPKRKQRWPARLLHKWKSFQKKNCLFTCMFLSSFLRNRQKRNTLYSSIKKWCSTNKASSNINELFSYILVNKMT